MNACAAPKKIAGISDESVGSGGVCVNVSENRAMSGGEGFAVLECRNLDTCKVVSRLFAPRGDAVTSWRYTRFSDEPGDGSSTTISTIAEPGAAIGNCESTQISWDAPDDDPAVLTVNGISSVDGSTPGPTVRTGGT